MTSMFSWSAITAAQSKSAEAWRLFLLLTPNMTETAATEESDATDLNGSGEEGEKKEKNNEEGKTLCVLKECLLVLF